MIDDKTPNLQLPLPHEDNLLEDDVNRLRAALTLVDTEVKTAGTKAAWATVSGKPGTFPPATHAHAYADVTGKPENFPPASHTHPAADVGDIDAAKITTGTLPVTRGGTGNTTGNAATATLANAVPWNGVTDKPATFPPATHNHATTEITSGTLPVARGGTGNATTATKLQTACTISLSGDVTGTTTFDGSASVTISTTVQSMSNLAQQLFFGSF